MLAWSKNPNVFPVKVESKQTQAHPVYIFIPTWIWLVIWISTLTLHSRSSFFSYPSKRGTGYVLSNPKPQSCLMNFTHQDGCLRAIWHQGDWLNPRLVHSCSFYLCFCLFFFSFGLCKMCLCCMFSTFPVWRDGLKTVSSVKPESFLKRTLEAILEALSLDSSWRDV